jgi:hypothetical protein
VRFKNIYQAFELEQKGNNAENFNYTVSVSAAVGRGSDFDECGPF